MNTYFDQKKFIDSFFENSSKLQKKTFCKGETITSFIQKRNQICILFEGHCDLIRYDYLGHKNIIEHYSNNSIFGEAFYSISLNNELVIEAKTKCIVFFFTLEDVYTKNNKFSIEFQEILKNSFSNILLTKIIEQNKRIELLANRSIRDKLLGYFTYLSKSKLSKSFVIDFSLTDLADYLNVDRCAMMREITYLKKEKIIEKLGNRITLLYK